MTSIEAEFLEHRPTGDPQRPYETRPLVSLYDGSLEHPRLLLLGDPGGGKSTALKRLALSHAEAFLRGDPTARLPVLVPLGANRRNDPLPLFVRQRLPVARFKEREIFEEDEEALFPSGLPGGERLAGRLDEYLKRGRVVLLFDGLNEIPQTHVEEATRELEQFVIEHPGDGDGNRFIFSCRRQDYTQPLGLRNLPRIEVKTLSDDQVERFIQVHAGAKGQALRDYLSQPGHAGIPAAASSGRTGALVHRRRPDRALPGATIANPPHTGAEIRYIGARAPSLAGHSTKHRQRDRCPGAALWLAACAACALDRRFALAQHRLVARRGPPVSSAPRGRDSRPDSPIAPL